MNPHVEDAYTMFEAFNEGYFSSLIRVPRIRLSSRMTRCAGQAWLDKWEMVLSLPYHNHYGWDEELWNTVGHETVHLYLHTIGHNPNHTAEFMEHCTRIGSTRWAKPLPRALPQYVYRCIACQQRVIRYARWRKSRACPRCCDKYNQGKYSTRFALQLEQTIRMY